MPTTNLTAGSIAFTGLNGSGNDNLSFVVLTDITSGTVINFTDNNWDGAQFGGKAESIFTWTATGDVAAGTVIDINNLKDASLGLTTNTGSVAWIDTSNTGLKDTDETVYAYVGPASSPTFLAAVANDGFSANGVLTNTGLVEGQTAVNIAGPASATASSGYSGPLSGAASFADYLSQINNPANWSTSAAVPFATAPFTVSPVGPPAAQVVSFTGTTSITQNEGDAGPQTVNFTVQRTGGTVGDLHFTIKVVGSSGLVNGDDFGGTMPTSIEGVILAGQTTATFTLTYTGDTRYEAKDGITIQLIAASNDQADASVATGSKGLAHLTLTNDDPVPTKVAAGDIVEGSVPLTGDQTFVIEKGGLMIGSSANIPITWADTDSHVTIDNSGTIQAALAGSAISLNSSATGSMEIDNHLGGQILGLVSLNSRPGATVTVNNDGLIDGGIGFANKIGGGGGTVNNSATGIITMDTANGTAIGNGGDVQINNWGKIVVPADTATLSGGDAIDFKETLNNSVHNYSGGLIEGSHHGITGSLGVTVVNDAGGSIIGRNGSAVNIDNDADPANTVYVTNHGDLEGRSAGYADSDGDAIDTDGLLHLDNFGMIQALGANGTHDGGANVSEGVAIGGGEINNYAGATIYGYGRAIQVDDSANGGALGATTIYNEGTIQGDGHGPQNFEPGSDAGIVIANREAIDILGTFNDTITNKGHIIGGVFTDGGNDTFNAYAGSSVTGQIDLGTGNDTLNLFAGNGSGSIGKLSNVEHVDLHSGDWTLGSEGFTDIALDTGAQTLRLAANTLSDHHFDGTITGFGTDDRIDLEGIGAATAAKLTAGNVLTVTGGSAGTVTLQLDPAQDYANKVFLVASDGNGGSLLTVANVVNLAKSGQAFHAGDDNNQIAAGNGGNTITAGNGNNSVVGGNGADTVTLGNGNNTFDGGNGADRIAVGTGNNTLTGGNGGDAFAFGPSFGNNVITDFQHSDHIEFDGGAFANFQAVQAAMHQVGADTVISLGVDHTITLHGVALNSLHASDFVFV